MESRKKKCLKKTLSTTHAVAPRSCGAPTTSCSTICDNLVLMSPLWRPGDASQTLGRLLQATADLSPRVLHHSSARNNATWLLQIDGFASPGEQEEIIAAAHATGFYAAGYYSERYREQRVDPAVRNNYVTKLPLEGNGSSAALLGLVRRLERALGVPRDFFEPPGVVRYSAGEYHHLHHDTGASLRLLSCFLYLRAPASGGETYFPRLQHAVAPSPGRLLVWPNVHWLRPVECTLKFVSS